MGLREDEDRDVCVRAIEALYPGHRVREFGEQGYCSCTLEVSPRFGAGVMGIGGEYIVQIRPVKHALDGGVADAARRTYGALAPGVRELGCVIPGGLKAVEMGKLRGVPLSNVEIVNGAWWEQVRLVESFAKVVVMAWPSSVNGVDSRWVDLALIFHTPDNFSRRMRADTPTEGLWLEQHCAGKVGREIVAKLRKLAANLPDEALRERARATLFRLLTIEQYPVVLNHGDLIPSNVLVDADSWTITGLVDWAEAEMLPFGTCLYGLEYLLGSLTSTTDADGSGGKPVWTYFEGSDTLRLIFWAALKKEKCEIVERLEEVMCMRDLGVLLWFGYAWDEGAIDRVVNDVVSISPR